MCVCACFIKKKMFQIFSVDVFEEGSRKALSAGHFFAILKDIVEQGSDDCGDGLGVLTTENRDNWADMYEELKKGRLIFVL